MRLHPYLHLLVGHGYAVLDWPWIIASGEHIYRVLKPPSAVRDEEQRFTERASALGYAHISDVALREDYQKVLSPGARIAGSIADLAARRSDATDVARLDSDELL